MGLHRSVIHPVFGSFVLLNTVLIDAELDEYSTPLDYTPCLDCKLCTAACPTGAIRFGSKEDMLDFGAGRVADLKERGFAQAAVYDPQGVGGTHVMYVLQHADQPELYHGLPKDPQISPLVSLWKGMAKPLAVAAMIGAAVIGFFHYVKVGPIETKDDSLEDAS